MAKYSKAIWIALAVLILCQLLKFFVLSLPIGDNAIAVNRFVRFVHAWNTGIGFGLLAGIVQVWTLIVIKTGIAFGLLWWSGRSESRWHKTACGMMAGGALGNSLDRVLHHAVLDYIWTGCCGYTAPFVFNLSDVFIVLGCLILITQSRRKPENSDPHASPEH